MILRELLIMHIEFSYSWSNSMQITRLTFLFSVLTSFIIPWTMEKRIHLWDENRYSIKSCLEFINYLEKEGEKGK